ncbi:hypothetical protein Tco_0987391 [Tanacetum coccineum]
MFLAYQRPFNRTTAPEANFSNQKVNTAEVKAVSAVRGKGKLLLSPHQVVIGDPKDSTGTNSPNTIDNPQRALKNKGIVDSGCSRHMTGNVLKVSRRTKAQRGSMSLEARHIPKREIHKYKSQ